MDLLAELWFWCLLHGALLFVSVAVLPRDTEAFDEVFTLFFAPYSQPCLAMAAAVGLCDCVLVARVASPAVAPLLCWWGSERATALVKWHDYKPDVYESTGCKIDLGSCAPVSECRHRTSSSFLLVCAVCSYGAAVCCAMPTHAREERRLDCWLTATPSLLFCAIISSSDALDGRRL
ncbi:hypothetical protein TcCL_ESM10594 [Trypanosoma cruzi]|nr:hypothetical protein TcCL_ESM10594 [Trypanosoma cruzi]